MKKIKPAPFGVILTMDEAVEAAGVGFRQRAEDVVYGVYSDIGPDSTVSEYLWGHIIGALGEKIAAKGLCLLDRYVPHTYADRRLPDVAFFEVRSATGSTSGLKVKKRDPKPMVYVLVQVDARMLTSGKVVGWITRDEAEKKGTFKCYETRKEWKELNSFWLVGREHLHTDFGSGFWKYDPEEKGVDDEAR